MKYISLTACSNGLSVDKRPIISDLRNVLADMDITALESEYIYAADKVYSAPADVRADILCRSFEDGRVSAVCDVSGGDIANEIIPYTDFSAIGKSQAEFWGYSDLTVLINAIYTRCGKSSVLYQIRNIADNGQTQRRGEFERYFSNGDRKLFEFPYRFFNGKSMSGIVVGGNIRCLLKLAGTEFFPNLDGKILFLESLGSDYAQTVACFAQLKIMGAFDRVSGVLLGTFTNLEKTLSAEETAMLAKIFTENLPLAKTQLIGHSADSKALRIGDMLNIAVL